MENNNSFEFSVNSSHDGVWDYDIVTQEFTLSKEWKKRLGFEEDEELTYFKYLELIPDENRFEHHQAMHEALEEYEGNLEYIHFKIKYPLVTKSGEELTVEDVGNIFFNEDETPIRIKGFHKEVSE